MVLYQRLLGVLELLSWGRGRERERDRERKCESICVDLSSVQGEPGVTGYAGCFIPAWPDYKSIAQVLNAG